MFKNKASMKTRIRSAQTIHEVDKLLREGDTFKYAKPKTRRQWHRIAKTRSIAIRGGDVEETT